MRILQSTCRSFALLLCSCLAALAVDTSKYSQSITLSYELISSTPQAVKPLCTVFYDPKTLRYTLSSWTPPSTDDLKSTSSEPQSAPLLRILLPNGSSTVTSLATFSNDLSQHISLWISPESDGSIFSASVTSTSPPPLTLEEERLKKKIERAKARGKPIPTPPKQKPSKKSKKDKTPVLEPRVDDSDGPKVNVVLIPAKPGPSPKLGSRAPPQVDASGNEIPQQDEVEKSFFQKYWWVFLAAAVLVVGAGGGDK